MRPLNICLQTEARNQGMTDYHNYSKKQLIKELERLKSEGGDHASAGAKHSRHDLEVYQIELEMQNRELRDKQLELELARDKYADLYDFAPVGFLTLDDKGIIREINLTATGLLGQPRSRLLNRPFAMLFAKDESREIFQTLRTVLDTGEERSVEVKLAHNGIALDFLVQMAAYNEKDNSVVRLALLDITERKQIEEALREERDFAEGLIETAHVIVLVLDREARIVRFNRYMEELSGYHLDEVKGKDWFATFIPDDEQQRITKLFDEAIHDKPIHGNINPIVIKDGSQRLIEWYDTKLKDEKGNISGLLATGLDITQRNMAERRLRISESDLHGILESLQEVYYRTDNQGVIVRASPSAFHITGCFPEELIGKPITQFWRYPEKRELLLNAMKTGGGIAHDYEVEVLKKSGRLIWCSVNAHFFHDESGKVAGIEGTIRDITHRKLQENKTLSLLQQNRELTQRMFQIQEDERRYIARELHDEFGQWLTAIQFDVQNIANLLGKHSPKVDVCIESITNSARQIQDGIHTMIYSLRPTLLDELGLADSLQELVQKWQEIHPDITCHLELPDGLDDIVKDNIITLYRIVQESLTNVSKHAGATQVDVTLTYAVNGSNKHGSLLLCIKDDGIGFQPEGKTHGFGLLGMRERVLSSGGTFAIHSPVSLSDNRGTRIEAQFRIDL